MTVEEYSKYYKDTPGVADFRKEVGRTQALNEDYEMRKLITDDMSQIWSEFGGQDGMYENFPIFRVYRNKDFSRYYGLDGAGGVAIIVYNGGDVKYYNKRFQVVTLGEDDAWHFLNSRRLYEDYYGHKVGFVHLLSEVLSLFNNEEPGE